MTDSDHIPKSKLSRSGIAASAAFKAGARKLGHLSKQPFRSGDARIQARQAHEEALAKIIFAAGGKLKGVALKAAQLLSMESELLSDSVREELNKACYQAPSINRALLRKTIKNRLGDSPDVIFRSFESEPFAAASLGQVHGAISQTGTNLAVKIQYPGIADTINSDLALLKKMAVAAPGNMDFHGFMNELEARLLEETDYQREAEQTSWFRKHLTLDGLVIPEVFPDFSGPRILTTTRLEGLHPDAWLGTIPTQDEKNRIAQLLMDLLIRSCFELNRFHGDPNLGNFLINEKGELGLIDFGCVLEAPPLFADNFRKILRAFYEDDLTNLEQMQSIYGHLGIQINMDRKREADVFELIRPWAQWWRTLLNPDGFDFGANPGMVFRGMELRQDLTHYFTGGSGLLAFLDRNLHGYFRLFEKMGATVKLNLL